VRFLLDEDLHPAVAAAAWDLGVDAVSVHELKQRGRSDHDLLELAAERGRVLVTRNHADFLYWTQEFYQAGRGHAGVLLVGPGFPNDQPGTLARTLRRWAEAHAIEDEEERFGPYHVGFLERR
jgi:predicted nuclease of predicted toxin-antitoxin system